MKQAYSYCHANYHPVGWMNMSRPVVWLGKTPDIRVIPVLERAAHNTKLNMRARPSPRIPVPP